MDDLYQKVKALNAGPSYPTAGSMLSKWIPPHERGAAMSIVDTGTSIASMCTFSLSPILAMTFGWQFAFRCFGYVSLGICGLWAVFASNTPRDCPYMSEDERQYLVNSGVAVSEVYGRLHHSPSSVQSKPAEPSSSSHSGPAQQVGKRGSATSDRTGDNHSAEITPSAPSASPLTYGRLKNGDDNFNTSHLTGKHLKSSSAVAVSAAPSDKAVQKLQHRFPWYLFGFASPWATIFAHAAFNFGRYFVYNQIVTYYVEVVGTTAVVAGQQVFIGQIADTLGKFGFAPFVDSAIRKNPASKSRIRKTVSGCAFIVFAASMLVMASSHSLSVVTSALVVCKIASSVHVCGFKTAFLDITSKHTGSLTGASNTLATLSAMLSPMISGKLLSFGPEGWVHTFFIIAVVNVVACLVWVSFFSADSLDDRFPASKTTQ